MVFSVADVVKELRSNRRLAHQVVDNLYLEASEPRFGTLNPPLPKAIAAALAKQGIDELWTHQVDGLEAVRRGENVLVTTPTASGKSLIFHLPVLEEAARGGPGRALFLYPLKALGQDQKGKFDDLAAASGLKEVARCEIYDGDTPRSRRQKIKEDLPRVLVSNPDMLHLGILSYWQQWEGFLKDLRWVVIDELHTYRGIFGSHFHHVLQRLQRICRSVGSDPIFISSSATAANADEFGHSLTDLEFRWLSESGAPREGRHFLLVQPESSPYTATLQLFAALQRAGMKTIVFTKARRITELLFSWLRRQEPELATRVASYRSGFLAEERRKIEADLFEGRLDGVISTSALEMGIDVGGLDACILVGYPGSVMATWQRSGRVGRAERESITALVAMPDALDQYFIENPQELVGRPCERLIVDPDNELVSRGHLVCAAAEMPLSRTKDTAYLERRAALVGELLAERELIEAADGSELYTRRRRPQRKVSLRGVDSGSAILDMNTEKVIGTVDGIRALRECHPGAVYLHAGRQYLVRQLDLEAGRVHAEPTRVDYFTVPLTEKETRILEIVDSRQEGSLQAWLGRLRVTERVVGYERKKIQSREVLDRHELDLPPVQFETVGLWWAVPRALEAELKEAGRHFMGSLHAAEHAAISLMPLTVVCDRGDIGGISIPLHNQVRAGSVFIYDGHAGGVGISAKGFEELRVLLGRVVELLEGCDCQEGCPSCVQSPKCGNGNRPLDKKGALALLTRLLAEEGESPGIPVEIDLQAGSDAPEEGTPETDSAEVREPVPGTELLSEEAPEPARVTRPKPTRQAGTGGGTVLFDLETQLSAADVGGWQNAHRMLVAIGVVCHLEEGRLESFGESEVGSLIERLEGADLVVGFNIARFDYKVLSGYTGVDYRRTLSTLDLLEEVRKKLGFRLSLDHLANATLGVSKSADGLQSLEWVQQGRLDLVEEYCRHDVEILRDLYLFGRRMGHVLYVDRDDRKVKLPVEW
jgi:DEAD/DEAH box helicase domain-containing protein